MNVYILNGYRSAVGKAPRGIFKSLRPDDLAAQVVKGLMAKYPNIPTDEIDDCIVGNATPEAEQGLNIGRMISMMGLDTVSVPGMTVNRYCSSGLESIAIAAAKIQAGMADCIIAGGVETMSPIPFGGWRIVPNYKVSKSNPDWYWGMGNTAEAVAQQYKVSRQAQDEFAYQSHKKALEAQSTGRFDADILPVEISDVYLDEKEIRRERSIIVNKDEGPRKDTSLEALSRLKPVFSANGTVTAGNASQTSDGAAFVLVVSEEFLKRHQLEPDARFVSYHVSGLEPRVMGMGPLYAVPKALKKAGLQLSDISLVELNEAFASQSLAVINELGLNADLVNVNGGAIALGHPLGCTGCKLTVQVLNELEKRKQKYGMVTMCVGTGQGAAGIFEKL